MPTLAQNKKALFDYDILEKIEAGLELSGAETKSAKAGNISLKGAFVTFHGDEANLTNANISKYGAAGPERLRPHPFRRLLLLKKQINYLRGKALEQGLTIVPISVYTRNRFIKLEIAVARGRKQYDKREVIKKRDLDKEVKRSLKQI